MVSVAALAVAVEQPTVDPTGCLVGVPVIEPLGGVTVDRENWGRSH